MGRNRDGKDEEAEDGIREEVEQHDDILRVDAYDAHDNLSEKTLALFTLLSQHFPAHFYFKVDDDVAVNMEALTRYLAAKTDRGNLYMVRKREPLVTAPVGRGVDESMRSLLIMSIVALHCIPPCPAGLHLCSPAGLHSCSHSHGAAASVRPAARTWKARVLWKFLHPGLVKSLLYQPLPALAVCTCQCSCRRTCLTSKEHKGCRRFAVSSSSLNWWHSCPTSHDADMGFRLHAPTIP